MRAGTLLCWAISLPAMGIAAVILTGCPAWADDESAAAGELSIENIAATSARAGETTRLTFTVRNDGPERVLISGVEFPSGEPSRVVGFLGGSHAASIGVLVIAPGEEVRLGRRGAWVEVGPLKADLSAGSRIAARLSLGWGSVPLTVHVGPPKAAALTGTPPEPAAPL